MKKCGQRLGDHTFLEEKSAHLVQLSWNILTPGNIYLVHQHDKDADLSLYSALGIFGDWPLVTPQFHFGALSSKGGQNETK